MNLAGAVPSCSVAASSSTPSTSVVRLRFLMLLPLASVLFIAADGFVAQQRPSSFGVVVDVDRRNSLQRHQHPLVDGVRHSSIVGRLSPFLQSVKLHHHQNDWSRQDEDDDAEGSLDPFQKELDDLERVRAAFEDLISRHQDEYYYHYEDDEDDEMDYEYDGVVVDGEFVGDNDDQDILYGYHELDEGTAASSLGAGGEVEEAATFRDRVESINGDYINHHLPRPAAATVNLDSLDDEINNENGGGAILDSLMESMVLTSTGRYRRQLEMDLLKSLETSDDAVEELMHLWMYEHTCGEGCDDGKVLEQMEHQLSPDMKREEEQLRGMMSRYPRWAEPYVRLATLLFYKGRTDEAYSLAASAIELKPWHFECYTILVMLSLRQQNMGQALRWARQALPPLQQQEDEEGPDEKQNGPVNWTRQRRSRKAWVERQVKLAQEQLDQMERITVEIQRAKEQQDQLRRQQERRQQEGVWQ